MDAEICIGGSLATLVHAKERRILGEKISRQKFSHGVKLIFHLEAQAMALVQEGLAAANLSDYLAATPKRRQQQTLQAIQEAVKKDSAAFNRALKEVIRGLESVSTAPQTATTPASEVKDQEDRKSVV